jgi:hypothetical protein
MLTKLVTVPSTVTLCFLHDIKLMSQLIIYGLRFVDFNFCVKNIVRDAVKRFAEIEGYYTNEVSLRLKLAMGFHRGRH